MLNTCKSSEKPKFQAFGQEIPVESGKRVSNTLVIYPSEGDNLEKSRLIPHIINKRKFVNERIFNSLMD